MAIKITNDTHYQAIADAIREQNGETDTYKPSEMAQAILDIEGGGGECFDTSQITDARYLFLGYEGHSLDCRGLNTENVTNMSNMFQGCSAITSLDLSSFNTGKVANMSYMFQGCSAITSLDLSSFNTENVTNMNNMFQNCSAITSLDLSSFNTENVTNMSNMFRNCSSLQTVFTRSQADATKFMSGANTPSGITFKNHDGTIYGVT